jgi:ABC-type glycerol-3-phosphate transport system permease component
MGKKGEMRLQDFLIGILIAALFLTVLLGFAYSMYSEMDVTLDNTTSDAFAAFETSATGAQTDIFGHTMDMQRAAPGGSESTTDTSKTAYDNIVGSGINLITLFPKTYSTFNNLIQTLANKAGIPGIFVQVLIAVVVILITIIFVSSVLRNRL